MCGIGALISLFILVVNCQRDQADILSVFGYSQDIHFSQLYRAVLFPNGTVTEVDLLSFAPGCHDDCPNFSTVFDSVGYTVFLKITYGLLPVEFINAFAVMEHTSVVVDYPENATAMYFYGNGTAYYLQENPGLDSNFYTIMMWNAYNDSESQITAQTTTYTIYRACLSNDHVYALDRENSVLIVWPISTNSNFQVIPLGKNRQWFNSIESICASTRQNSHIYALDRTGSIWTISLYSGSIDPYLPPQWPAFKSNVAANQLIISPYSDKMYYLGYDVRINNYVLVTFNGFQQPTVIPLFDALHGMQWIGLTMFSPAWQPRNQH